MDGGLCSNTLTTWTASDESMRLRACLCPLSGLRSDSIGLPLLLRYPVIAYVALSSLLLLISITLRKLSSMDDLLESIQRAANDTKDRIVYLIYDEELNEFPSRILESVVGYMNASLDAVTGHGTMLPNIPHIPLPAAVTDRRSLAPAVPAVPPTLYERITKHLKDRRYLYSVLGGTTFTLLITTVAVNFSPRFRGQLFGQAPFMRRIIYVRGGVSHRGMRPLPPHPRPRFSADGVHRLEAVLILGAEQGSYGREVAKFFANRDFIVVATVSSVGEMDELESLGNGFLKAVVLDPSSTSNSSSTAFLRSLNTALSLRYPLHSAGDPFHNISSSNLQLVSVINCLPLSSPPLSPSVPLPLEALPSEHLSHILQSTLVTSLNVIQKILPLFRNRTSNTRAHKDVPATIITCLPGPERYLGTPFSGTNGAVRGIASNALASAMDVLRREIAASITATASGEVRQREIKIVNLDVGFLEPVRRRGHEQQQQQQQHAGGEKGALSVRDQVEETLPRHLKEIYAPALAANMSFEHPHPHGQEHERRSRRNGLRDSRALSEKLLKIVLAKKGSHIPDRTSVGAGVTTYYIASLLPTSFIDLFFSWRHKVLLSRFGRKPSHGPASAAGSGRRGPLPPLPLPGQPSPPSPFFATFASSEPERYASGSGSGSGSASSESGLEQEIPLTREHESDTFLPPYAPSTPGSAPASQMSHSASEENESESDLLSTLAPSSSGGSAFSGSGYTGSETGEGQYARSDMARSTTLGDSFVQL